MPRARYYSPEITVSEFDEPVRQHANAEQPRGIGSFEFHLFFLNLSCSQVPERVAFNHTLITLAITPKGTANAARACS
jgi:hypothetical protein